MIKKLLPLLLAAVLLLTGCSAGKGTQTPSPKDFSAAGMTITLTDDFVQKDQVNLTGYYLSDEIAVLALLEEYSLFENTDFSSDSSVEEYAQLVWSANGFQGDVELTTEDDLTCFTYESQVNGNTYAYRAYVFKDAQGFWLIQFSTFKDSADTLLPQFLYYAKSITFDNPYTPAAE